MRILTENETAVLVGDLSKIKLPSGVELYLSYGIPQIFQRVSSTSNFYDDKDWLFVPLEILESIKQNNNNIPKMPIVSVTDDTPLICDKHYLFPIFSGNEIDIIFMSNSKDLNINAKTLNSVMKTFVQYKELIVERCNCSDKFIKALISHNDSQLNFAKSILNLIVKEIPRSCAGYYSSDESGLKRRFIVGDIHKFEHIPPVVSSELTSVWKNSLYKNNYYIVPSNFQNDLQFLSTPPDINFIYQGLQSKISENYISVQLPSSAIFSSIYILEYMVEHIHKLSESEFMKPSSVIEMYDLLTFKTTSSTSEVQIAEKLFSTLNNHIRITSLVYMSENDIIEVGYTNNNEYQVIENRSMKLSQESQALLQEFEQIVVTNTENKIFSENSQQQINSEILSQKLYKLHVSKNHFLYLILGSPKQVGTLELYSPLIDEFVNAFKILISSVFLRNNLKKAYFKEKILHARLKLINVLSNGYFNQIFSKLTVLIAKTELVNKHISSSENKKELSNLEKPILSISHNTDLIENYITSLRSLMPNREEYYERKLNPSEIMKKIPTLLQGYLHQTYIKNNISIRLDNVTHSKSDFFIAGYVIDDVLIPIILTIIDDAILDGTISLYAGNELETVYVKVAFHKDLIATHDISSMIHNVFKEHDIEITTEGQFTFSNCVISNNINSNGMVTLHINVKQENNNVRQSIGKQQEVSERV